MLIYANNKSQRTIGRTSRPRKTAIWTSQSLVTNAWKLTSDTNLLAKDIKLRSVSHRFTLIRYRLDKEFSASRSALTAPNQGLLIHLLEINSPFYNILAQFDRTLRLVTCQMLIGWPIKVFIPNTAAYMVEYDALKTVILKYWPIPSIILCHRWKNHFCEVYVGTD